MELRVIFSPRYFGMIHAITPWRRSVPILKGRSVRGPRNIEKVDSI